MVLKRINQKSTHWLRLCTYLHIFFSLGALLVAGFVFFTRSTLNFANTFRWLLNLLLTLSTVRNLMRISRFFYSANECCPFVACSSTPRVRRWKIKLYFIRVCDCVARIRYKSIVCRSSGNDVCWRKWASTKERKKKNKLNQSSRAFVYFC